MPVAATTMKSRVRRGFPARDLTLRSELATESAPKALSGSFLRNLSRIDRDLEMFWVPPLQHWVLYRVARKGPCPSDDMLIKVANVIGPNGEYREPGPWVISLLQKTSLTRRFSGDPRRAGKLWADHMDEMEEQRIEIADRNFSNANADMAHDLRKCFIGKCTYENTKSIVREKKGSKIIFGPEEQERRLN